MRIVRNCPYYAGHGIRSTTSTSASGSARSRRDQHEHQPTTFRVFFDPAGHPFCLCVD